MTIFGIYIEPWDQWLHSVLNYTFLYQITKNFMNIFITSCQRIVFASGYYNETSAFFLMKNVYCCESELYYLIGQNLLS